MKNYYRLLIFTIALLFCQHVIFSQNSNPKREFRGVWVATVSNIDFPNRKGLSQKAYEDNWKELVQFYKDHKFNALITQIRPVSDAFYPSKLAPWSAYLSGYEGEELEPGFDPLEYKVKEAHKNGMEFHAWLNPYRATATNDLTNISDIHPLNQHPEWGIQYGNKWYLNPARPEVRNYITEIVEELLVNYDIDAIHFDDYFYPYKIAGESFPDSLDYENYGFGFSAIEDWRRSNTDALIEQVSLKIKSIAPHVKFGISPFGVWRNSFQDPVNGSETRAGQTCYDDLYADILKWLEREWIDYVAPQVYWNIGYPPADYEILTKWWNDHTFDRHLYIGQAAYKIGKDKEKEWNDRRESPKQLQLSRSLENISGNIFYSSKPVMRNPLGLADSLKDNYYSTLAVLPAMPFLELEEPTPPTLEKVRMKKGKIRLKWNIRNQEEQKAYCIVYRFEDSKPGDFDKPENMINQTEISDKGKWEYVDESFEKGKTYTYVISSLNQAHEESDLSNYRTVEVKERRIKRIR